MPLSVVYSNKLCLVVDASRHINPFMTKRIGEIDDLVFLVREGDYIVVDDLDSGYWHVLLHVSQYLMFGVSIYDETLKRTSYYQWLVLFLGLMDTMQIFTKLLLPVVKHLQMCGWEAILYIDDAGTLGRSYYKCLYWKLFARDVQGQA